MKVVQADEAAKLIRDGDAVVTTGFIECSVPELLCRAIEKRFLETGHPKGLTLLWGAALGDGKGNGIDHLGHEGLTDYIVSAHLNLVPKLQALVDGDKIKAHVLPLGTMAQLYRESGAGRPGLITKIGLGTYADPRIAGAKANASTTEDICEIITLGGEEYIHYFPLPMNVALIHGTTADSKGNISIEREAVIPEALAAAQNVKRNGGIVIAEVEGLCEHGHIHPRDVLVPGFMVDYVVVEPKDERRMVLTYPEFDPALAHEYRISLKETAPMKLDERKVIARRCALELKAGNLVNLGLGMPEGVSSVVTEAGCNDRMILTIESGFVDCTPLGSHYFGSCYNADYNTDLIRQMDWYDGGALDIAFLGAAQVDRFGNANVSKFSGRTVGPGGFINIAHTARKVCYCGTLTAGGLKTAVRDGKLIIESEGRVKKYIRDVEQISFCGKSALEAGQEILYITERAVFRLTDRGLLLIEIAPGMDLQTQVLNMLEFDVEVAQNLKIMDSSIFEEAAMPLPDLLDDDS